MGSLVAWTRIDWPDLSADSIRLDSPSRPTGVEVDLARVQDRVPSLADVDERRLHGGKHVLHPAQVHVAHVGLVAGLVHVVLDQDPVLEHGDLGPVVVLPDHHDPLDGLAPGQELRLGDDRRPAPARLRPSRRRCRLASSRVDPLTPLTSGPSSAPARDARTWTTVFGGSSAAGASASAGCPLRRLRLRRLPEASDSAEESSAEESAAAAAPPAVGAPGLARSSSPSSAASGSRSVSSPAAVSAAPRPLAWPRPPRRLRFPGELPACRRHPARRRRQACPLPGRPLQRSRRARAGARRRPRCPGAGR